MGLIVDTSEFIFLERQGLTARAIFERYGWTETYGLATVTLAELQHGVERSNSSRRRLERERFLNDVSAIFIAHPLSRDVALRVGKLDANLTVRGLRVALADLIIAATALELSFSVATRNVKDFERIPGLHLAQSTS